MIRHDEIIRLDVRKEAGEILNPSRKPEAKELRSLVQARPQDDPAGAGSSTCGQDDLIEVTSSA